MRLGMRPTAVRLVLDDYRVEFRLSLAGVTIARLSISLTRRDRP